MSAPFCWPCSISVRLSPSLHCWCPPFSVGHVAFLFISQVCHWWCPPLDAGHVAFLYSFVSQVCHRSVFSAGHAAFLFICPPGLSLVVSALFRCFYSFVSQVCHCWCPPFSVGHVAFLFICLPGLSLPVFCLPGLSLLVSALAFLFISLPGLSLLVPALFLALQHFYSFVFQVCHCWCPPFSAGHAAFLFICYPGLSLVLPPLSAGHVAFLFICLPCDFFLFVFQVWCLHCCFLPCPLEQVRLRKVLAPLQGVRDCLRDCIPATLCNSQLCFPFRATVG